MLEDLVALTKSRDFVAVATGGHIAPATVMRAGAVVEPEDALGAVAAPNETEVAGSEEFGCGFGYRCENLFRGALLPFTGEIERVAFARLELQDSF